MIRKFENKIKELESKSIKIKNSLVSKPIVLLPAGHNCTVFIRHLVYFGIEIAYLCDKDEKKWGLTWEYNNKCYKVESTTEIVSKFGNDVNYMISVKGLKDEINKELMDMNIAKENIFDAPVLFGDLVDWDFEKRYSEIISNWNEIEKAINYLEDVQSRDTLIDLLAMFASRIPVWNNCQISEEYYNNPFFGLKEGEVFVDAGMFDGKTALRFIELVPSYEKIYGIEANPEFIDNIKQRLYGKENIHIFHNALTNVNKELKFRSDHGEGSKISKDGEVSIMGITGDSLAIHPTFIKLDIEGAEFDALEGFKNTIKEDKPKMAVSAYHSLKDHWRLINKIKEICPEYKISMIHHYGYEVLYGTILYARVEE